MTRALHILCRANRPQRVRVRDQTVHGCDMDTRTGFVAVHQLPRVVVESGGYGCAALHAAHIENPYTISRAG